MQYDTPVDGVQLFLPKACLLSCIGLSPVLCFLDIPGQSCITGCLSLQANQHESFECLGTRSPLTATCVKLVLTNGHEQMSNIAGQASQASFTQVQVKTTPKKKPEQAVEDASLKSEFAGNKGEERE